MISAIVVSYNPELCSFMELLRRLILQVDSLIIVDNSQRESNDAFDFMVQSGIDQDRVALIRLGDNRGIAAALNVGIVVALQDGAEFVLLSDQDSLPAEDMVPKLLEAYEALVERGEDVGAVGPTFTDLHTGLTYPFQAQLPGHFFYGHQAATSEAPHVEALTLITSGALIPAHVLHDVGPMREDFFIDQVDIEWCHRARSKGYRLFGTGWARMYQRMGEAHLRVWYLRWRHESAYSPLRIYYRLRNFVALWRLDFIGWRWKVRNSWYWLGIVYAHAFFGKKDRVKCFLYAIKGVWHGLRGKMGRLE
ncbi:glycosyltransferase family 2 protein [Geopseudomonas aromaticivorans]